MTSRSATHFSLNVIVCLITFGCAHLPKLEPSNQGPLPLQMEAREVQATQLIRPELGLALSGGGFRSAMYSFGVLKRLYDEGILQKVQIMSTVSGGGYTGYEVFLNELKKPAVPGTFGSATFESTIYKQRVLDHVLTGNFVTYAQAAKTLGIRPGAVALYEESIPKSFGAAETPNAPIVLQDLAAPIQAGALPYLIVNMTFVRPTPTGFADGVFEMTPLHAGNTRRGFAELSKPFKYSHAIAISGAAFASFLKQEIPDPTGRSGEFTLSDGGHSENLGAFALIRRGVKSIIIVDAEHDPAYSFGAYVNLRDRLKEWKSTLRIDSIETLIDETDAAKQARKRLASGGKSDTALHRGTATSTSPNGESVVSNIYYLKLSIPRTIDSDLTADAIAKGKSVHESTISYLKAHADANGNWDPSLVQLLDVDMPAWFAYQVDDYPKVIDSLFKVRFMRRIPIESLQINFPHFSTGDQSYFINQTLAFIGLGYFSAKEIKPAISL